MSKELLRDDSLPYREYFMRPGDNLDFAIEWSHWLSLRWSPGLAFAAGSVIRPRSSTGFEYLTAGGGMTAAAAIPSVEPKWPTALGGAVQDGSVIWTCQAISTASLVSSIVSSSWLSDAPVTNAGASLIGYKALVLANAPSNAIDGDYYLRNTILLANALQKVGVFLLKVRTAKIY